MLRVVDAEVLHASALVSTADEALARMLRDPVTETLALFVQLLGIEVVALELAVESQFCAEVGLADATASIGEMLLEVTEYVSAWYLVVEVVATVVVVHLGPLIDALAHLLTQCAQHDIVHRREHRTLARATPSVLHRCQIQIHALSHQIVEQIPLLIVPVGKELVAEHVDRVPRVVEVVRE